LTQHPSLSAINLSSATLNNNSGNNRKVSWGKEIPAVLINISYYILERIPALNILLPDNNL
jgi:hypothetical protein